MVKKSACRRAHAHSENGACVDNDAPSLRTMIHTGVSRMIWCGETISSHMRLMALSADAAKSDACSNAKPSRRRVQLTSSRDCHLCVFLLLLQTQILYRLVKEWIPSSQDITDK